MQQIPVIATPSQSFTVQLNGQNVQINLYSLETPGDILALQPGPTIDSTAITIDSDTVTIDEGQQYSDTALAGTPALYMDLVVDGVQVLNAALATNLVSVLAAAGYYDVVGDFIFVDTNALSAPLTGSNPDYTGLGDQYQLIYLAPEDLAA